MICPICEKGEIVQMVFLLICATCGKAWTPVELMLDIRAKELSAEKEAERA